MTSVLIAYMIAAYVVMVLGYGIMLIEAQQPMTGLPDYCHPALHARLCAGTVEARVAASAEHMEPSRPRRAARLHGHVRRPARRSKQCWSK